MVLLAVSVLAVATQNVVAAADAEILSAEATVTVTLTAFDSQEVALFCSFT